MQSPKASKLKELEHQTIEKFLKVGLWFSKAPGLFPNCGNARRILQPRGNQLVPRALEMISSFWKIKRASPSKKESFAF